MQPGYLRHLTSYLTFASLPLQLEVPDPITFDSMQSRSALSKEFSLLSIYCRPPWRFLGCLTQPKKSDIFQSSTFSKLQDSRKKMPIATKALGYFEMEIFPPLHNLPSMACGLIIYLHNRCELLQRSCCVPAGT